MIAKKLEEQDEIHEVNLKDGPKEEVRRPKPTLVKYMRRYHALDEINGDKDIMCLSISLNLYCHSLPI